MQNYPLDRFLGPSAQWLVPALGAIIFSQAASFGWPSKIDPVFSSHVQALCIVLAGFALLVLGSFLRSTQTKLARLEAELAQLKAKAPKR